MATIDGTALLVQALRKKGIELIVRHPGAWNIERKALEMDFGKEYVVATEMLRTRYDLMAAAMGSSSEYRPVE